jgi:hypothetical protein
VVSAATASDPHHTQHTLLGSAESSRVRPLPFSTPTNGMIHHFLLIQLEESSLGGGGGGASAAVKGTDGRRGKLGRRGALGLHGMSVQNM